VPSLYMVMALMDTRAVSRYLPRQKPSRTC